MQRSRPDWSRRGLLIIACVGLGCADDGGLAIRLAMPEAEALRPTSGGIVSDITLEAKSDAGGVQRLSRSTSDTGAGISLGALEPGDSISLAVELRSASGQLLGYGRTSAGIEIRAGKDTEVELNVRRPLTYLSNQSDVLLALDASRDLSGAFTTGIELAGTPLVTTTSADGGAIYVALGSGGTSSISLISTSTHLPSREIASGLRPSPVDLIVTGDGSRAVLAHKTTPAGAVGGVTVVDVAAASSTFSELGNVSRLALSPSGDLYALAARSPVCLSPQRTAVIYRFSLGDAESGTQIAFSGSAGDLVINPGTGELLVADPCAGTVVTIDRAATVTPFFDLAGASALSASGQGILIAGVDSDMTIRISTVDPEGALVDSVLLPRPMESTVSEDIDEEGQSVRVVAEADGVAILDIAAVPGAARVALLAQSFYDIRGGFNIPPMRADVWEYQLIDTASESTIQRVRTACDLVVNVTFETLVDWRCGSAPDQLALEPEFHLESVSVLFGDR